MDEWNVRDSYGESKMRCRGPFVQGIVSKRIDLKRICTTILGYISYLADGKTIGTGKQVADLSDVSDYPRLGVRTKVY